MISPLFHSKAFRANLLTERLKAPEIHFLLRNDYHEILESFFEEGLKILSLLSCL